MTWSLKRKKQGLQMARRRQLLPPKQAACWQRLHAKHHCDGGCYNVMLAVQMTWHSPRPLSSVSCCCQLCSITPRTPTHTTSSQQCQLVVSPQIDSHTYSQLEGRSCPKC